VFRGGVRGIIELVILEAILGKVGHGIPVQELFDVIVGTSTGETLSKSDPEYTLTLEGGIVALGIFKQQWTITEAGERFENLAKRAFSKRTGLVPLLHLPGGNLAAKILCTYLYKSTGIEHALQDAFGRDANLFGASPAGAEVNKVIVVATGEEEEKPFLLTNYNREWRMNDDESKYNSTSFQLLRTSSAKTFQATSFGGRKDLGKN